MGNVRDITTQLLLPDRFVKGRMTAIFGRAIIALFVLVAQPTSGQNSWHLIQHTDAMTDKVLVSASTTNDQGHELRVYRVEDGSAWMLFSLGPSSLDTLSPNRAPMYRVDKNSAQDLDVSRRLTERRLGLPMYLWEPRWVNFRIWSGKDERIRGVALSELLTGQQVVFRYYVWAGGYKETSFTLMGAGPAIAAALGISVSGDPAAEAEATALTSALISATRKCSGNAETQRACLVRVLACQKEASGSLAALQECLQ